MRSSLSTLVLLWVWLCWVAPGLADSAPVLPPAPSSQAVSDPWTGCTVSVGPGTMHSVRCAAAELRIMRALAFSGEPGVRTGLNLIGASPRTPVGKIRVGDELIYVGQHLAGAESKYVASPRENVLTICIAAAESLTTQCEPRILWMAEHGLPPGVIFPDAKLELAGVALRVPNGCGMLGAERIVCATAALDWREQKAGVHPLVALDAVLSQASGLRVLEREPWTCMLNGVRGEGRVYEVLVGEAPAALSACAVKRGEVWSQAQCIGHDPRHPGAFPEPCNQVFGPSTPSANSSLRP